jgi:uncharacterized membrane protein
MQVQVVLATFDDEEAANAAMEELYQARKAAQLDFDDSAVIRVDEDGTLHIKDAADFSTGKGAGRGALFGGVIGLLAGPAGAVLGASAGAVVGGLLNRGDEGFRNEALEALGEKLAPNSSAIVAVVPVVWASEFGQILNKHSQDVAVQVLDDDVVAQLQGNVDA